MRRASNALPDTMLGALMSKLRHAFRWHALIAEATPSKPRALYLVHRRGFAGQMRRGPRMGRYTPEPPRGDTIEDWPVERMWAELRERPHGRREPEIASLGACSPLS